MRIALFILSLLSALVLADSTTVNLTQIATRVIQRAHVNDIRTALSGTVVPRNSAGTVTDVAGDLGTLALRWNTGYFKTLKLQNAVSGNALTFAVPTLGSAYTLTWPTALPAAVARMTMDTSGNIGTTTGLPVYSSAFSGTIDGTTVTDFTSSSVTITSLGRPIWLSVIADANTCAINCLNTGANAQANGFVYFTDSSNTIQAKFNCGFQNGAAMTATFGVQLPGSAFHSIITPSAGTYTYKIRANGAGAQDRVSASGNCKFMALEL